MKTIVATFLSIILFYTDNYAQKHSSSYPKSKSFYTKQLMDSDAVYFTPENFNIKADGLTDVSDVLQQALYDLKTTHNFGILFLPGGKYLISKTIYVPQAIRVIGKSSVDCVKEKFTRLSTTRFCLIKAKRNICSGLFTVCPSPVNRFAMQVQEHFTAL
jgi:hypothetical protein